MIERILLRNFQRHRKLTINLESGVTTIVGRSDAGKSAILRALRWVCLNKPQGTSFIRRGQKNAVVTVDVKNGSIKRTRGPSRNEYAVSGQSSGTYKAFGTGVPEPVGRILNVSDVNFQRQHDPPFWLSEIPSQLAKLLNEVVDLSLIDDATNRVNREVRDAESEIKIAETMLAEARSQREQLAHVPLLDRELSEIEQFAIDASAIDERISTIRTALKTARGAVEAVGRLDSRLKGSAQALRPISAVSGRLESLRLRISDLRGRIDNFRSAESDVRTAIRAIRNVEKQLASFKVCPICRKPIHKS